MKVLKILVIMLVLIMSAGAVCAADAVSGDDIGSDDQTILETIQEDDSLETTQNDIYSEAEASFTDLAREINATDVLQINQSYRFNNGTDKSANGIGIIKDNFVIDGNGYAIDGNGQSRVFVISAANVTINNLTIINANRDVGSALFLNPGSSLTLNNVIFENNSAETGVVGVSQATLTTNNVTFVNNAGDKGVITVTEGAYYSNDDKFIDSKVSESGVITAKYGEMVFNNAFMSNSEELSWGFIQSIKSLGLTVLNSMFRDTVSNYSTAIRTDGMSLIRNTQFINLEAKITAGAIALRELDECIIEGCTFTNVSSDKNGGAIFSDVIGYEHSNDGLLLINGTIFTDCGSGFGGAVLHLGGDLVVDDSKFICNVASFDGGAIYVSYSDVTITNSLFDNNWAVSSEDRGSSGGAIYCDMSLLDLSYSNLTNNIAHQGSAAYLYNSNYNITNNLFQNNINFEGYDDDIFTVFDEGVCLLEDNTYSGKNSISIDNEDYASIVDFEGMRLVLINNTLNVTSLPSRFDLREMGWLTPVKDQGKKGACWTFGSSGAMESSILRFLGLSLDLSENNMEDISLMYYKYGVAGVWEGAEADSASNYALSWFGVFPSEYDVYDQLGKISPLFAVSNSIHFQDVLVIPPRTDSMDNDAMKWAILKYGALFINYYSLGDIVDQYYNGTAQINHGVSLVGWDDDREIEGAPGKGAWIIKNSWGTAAGEDGFMYVSYYDTSLSTVTSSYAYLLENTIPYNKNYQYDISGLFKYLNYTDQYFNAYVAIDDDLLAAVGTYFNDTDVEYTVKIYVNDELKHVQTGLSPFPGFHTIKLDSYVPIKTGDRFVVEIKSNNVPVLSGSRKHYIQGSSQIMSEGEWINITDEGNIACIKAYTVDSKTFTDLKNDIVDSGDVFDMDCDYRFDNLSDNSTKGMLIDRDNFTINGNGYIIDANGQSAIFKVISKNLTINNLTFINAKGGVLNIFKNATVTTNHVNFINSTADDCIIYDMGTYYSNYDTILDCTAEMGVIKVEMGELYVDSAVMTSSKMLNWGFIYTETQKSNITISNSIFANTTSNYSVAVRGCERTFISNTKFINLYSEISAGAVGLKDVIVGEIDRCTFINVSSQKNGGALLFDVVGEGEYHGNVSVINSSFVDCRSGFGGALIQYGGGLAVVACNFTNNTADFDGGAVYATKSKVFILNSTFTENRVEYEGARGSFGGAVYCDSSQLYFTNNNLTKNCAQYGGAISGYDLAYYIDGNIFKENTNFNGDLDDICTIFDVVSMFGANVFSSEDSLDLNNTNYASIVDAEGMALVILDNSIDISVIPSRFDLRDWGWVTPVRDQGRAGSCWTFGASGAIESAILRYLGIEMDVSENNMEDVSLEYNPYGVVTYTEGGLGEMGAAYALSWFGVFPSEYDVYDQLGKISPIIGVANSIHFQDVVFIAPRKNVTDNELMKRALMKYGALAVIYAADQLAPQLNPKTSAQYNNETEAPDHGVVLVGWDDSYSASNFLITPPGDGAWIIKNSWGANYGDGGYYYISYYDVNFATKKSSIAYVLENNVRYNKNYQYDIQGNLNFLNFSTEYRNNFVAVEDDLIAAVGTYFNDTNVEYCVEIYVNDALRVTQTGVSPFAGFHTIKLDSYVPIKKGDNFTVKITSNTVPFLVYSRQHYIEGSSQCLDYITGVWDNATDLQQYYGFQFVASVKAYTVADDTKIIKNSNLIVDYAGGSYFAVKVVTDDGHAVGIGEKVKFTIDGVNYYATTNAKGIAKIKIKLAPGKYVVKTKYNGKTYKNVVAVKNVLTASKVTIKKSTAKKLVLTAKLKINGQPVKGVWIKFKINGKIVKAKTNKNGIAQKTLSKKFINSLNRGTYKVLVGFGKDIIKTTVKIK